MSDRVDGWAVEAYPAGALKHWGLTSRGYKRSTRRAVLAELVDDLRAAVPWLDLGSHSALMAVNDNAFDAVVTALIARAASLGGTALPEEDDLPIAHREGWIHVPTGTLDDLR